MKRPILKIRKREPRVEDAHGFTLVLGAGDIPYPGVMTTNQDTRPLPGLDHVFDLDVMPWPLSGPWYDTIIAEHVLEHVRERLAFLDECHRLAVPGGTLIVEVPHYKHRYAFSMLDHRWFFTHNSFDPAYTIEGKFQKIRVEYRLFADLNLWLTWELLGRFLAKHTGLVSGLRFYLRIL